MNPKKYTLHLPKTSFPMKARLPETEPKQVQLWKDKNIYSKYLHKRAHKKFFSFLDGPPYANGELHIGHALNKILKDIVVKYQNLSGQHCPFIPVWDCHGLPIELSSSKSLKTKKSDMSPQEIREHCRKTALFWIKEQKKGFERLGVLADWENPLFTMDPKYEAEEVRALSQIAKKGLLYRGKKPVYWCFALKTAMASSEVEYFTHKSPSIYVKFLFPKPPEEWNLPKDKKTFFTIWTTTPWTLPANQAIALKADLTYGVFDTGQGFFLILAIALKESFEKHTGLHLQQKRTFKGRELEGSRAKHPFIKRDSLIVLGDHVSKEEGTGCVHTAPGHGLDDWKVGQKYKLPVTVPVDEQGRFTAEVPKWGGQHIFKANPLIIQELKQKGLLLAEKEITHTYPYNPRSSSPVIFRATHQWFIHFDKEGCSVRKKALSEIEKSIQFQPAWGKQRLKAMIQASPDWCLSRQRHWGVPIPVFYCQKCGSALIDHKLINHIADQMEQTGEGVEYWFSRSVEELVLEGISCPQCQGRDFKKGEDILDVWFDSGIAHYVFNKKYGEKTFPTDVYLEGSDQHRGWFQTSLNSSVCLKGKTPFKALVTHCFVNDAKGQKMSKSKGNVLNLQNLIQQRGAEIVRLWVCSEDYSQDLSVSQESFARVSEAYRRFRNTFRFMLGNLFDFDPKKDLVDFDRRKEVDKWILGRLAVLIQKSRQNYDKFLFHKVYQDLNVFFTTDLSSLYLDILKDRLYTFKKEGEARRSAQSTLYLLLKNLVSLMSPITSFLSEEVFSYIPNPKEESVFLTDFPTVPVAWEQLCLQTLSVDVGSPKGAIPSGGAQESSALGIREKFDQFLKIREEAYRQMEVMRKDQLIGSSLETKVKVCVPTTWSVFSVEMSTFQDDLREFLIVSQVEMEQSASGVQDQGTSHEASGVGGKPLGVSSATKEGVAFRDGWNVEVTKAEGEKCQLCWNFSPHLNKEALCPKCLQNQV